MSVEHDVAELLQWAGDHGGAFLWRRVCRDLSGGLRVGVASRDAAVGQRLIEALDTHDGTEWIPLTLGDAEATLGAQDRLLGVHVLVWATPVMAPMGAEERAAIDSLEAVGAPLRAAVVLGDWHLLDKLSDDPEAEGQEVLDRAQALIPEGWVLHQPSAVADWLTEARSSLSRLTAGRRATVSRVLLADALRRSEAGVTDARHKLAEIEALLAEEDATLEAIRSRGQRAAAHLLSAVRRQTQRLQIDLAEFLAALEGEIPAQIAAVDEIPLIRHTLPHWLQHVVERWLGDRLASWRVAVQQELTDLPLTEEDLIRAELLVPAVHPPLINGERDWTTRLGATAALGGGAALLLMGLWIPGLLAVGSGLGFSAFRAEARKARTREALTSGAVEAVRALGPELQRILDDQVNATSEALGDLGEERAQAHQATRIDARTELERQATTRSDRLAELERTTTELQARIDALSGAA